MGAHIQKFLFQQKILTWILELRARVEALEQLHKAVVELNERFSLEPLEARVEALEAKHAAKTAGADATPAPTDDKLLELCWENDTLVSLRLAYELGRQHGAAANSKPAPNFVSTEQEANR